MVALTQSTPDESLTTIAERAVRIALEGLIQLMEDPEVPAETRRKAATDALRYVGAAAARLGERPADNPQAAPPMDSESPAETPDTSRGTPAESSSVAATDLFTGPVEPAARPMANRPTPDASSRSAPGDLRHAIEEGCGGGGSARAREPPSPP